MTTIETLQAERDTLRDELLALLSCMKKPTEPTSILDEMVILLKEKYAEAAPLTQPEAEIAMNKTLALYERFGNPSPAQSREEQNKTIGQSTII